MGVQIKSEIPETYDELARALSALREKMASRELYLKAYERLVMSKVLSQQITLYNVTSQRKLGLRSAREGAMLNLQVKILRRNLLLLRERVFEIEGRMSKLNAQSPEAVASEKVSQEVPQKVPEVSENSVAGADSQPILQSA
jgi:hypothetical protein